MNVAIFTPNKNPYSETFIQAHKNFLDGNIFYYYGSKGHIQLEGLNSLVSKAAQWRFRFIRKLNKYSFSYINDKAVLLSLKKNAIDVVLVEYGTHAHSLRAILKASNLPIIVHFHGFDASVVKVIKNCNNYREVFELSSKVIVVSRKMEQILLELGCPSEKLIYNVYGPQPEFEKVQSKFTKKQFIGIGRFTDKKAPYYTIMAFKEVVAKHPDATLLLAGDGVLLNMCQNLVKHYELDNHVQFLGIVSPDIYCHLLSESLAFVQHSITAKNGDMEGTPLAILEASIAGLPVISTNHAGIPDVIIHEETGLLSEEHDVESMANNMKKLLDDIDFAKLLGQQGKKHIKANFSMDRHIDVLNNCIKSCV